jgi:hypothetical protein
MDWVDTLTQYLADNSLGEVGVDLFAGDMQDDGQTTVVTCLNEYNGSVRNVLGPNNAQVDVPMLQVGVRHKTASDAKERIKAIRSLLLQVSGVDIGGYHFTQIMPNGTIHDLGRDSDGRKMFSTNLEVFL